jgi:hypothetical protein
MSITKAQINKISDILEQVAKLNKMIHLHQQNEHKSMLEQYELMKQNFVDELNSILKAFEISVQAA